MKTTKTILILFAIICSVIYAGCEKTETPESKATVPQSSSANALCDGNGKTTFYPLDSADKWTYSYKISGATQAISPVLTLTDSATYGAYAYAIVSDASLLLDTMITYLREDTASHNIYNYNVNAAQEYLEVPAAGSIGQLWSVPGGLVKKITNLAADIHTASCWYTNLVEISVFSGTTIVSKYYYKKGFGLVYRKDLLTNKEFSASAVHFR